MKEEIRGGIKKQEEVLKRGLEEMRKELREREEKWRVEREELERGIGELERKIAGMGEEWRERCKEVERKLEIKESDERRKNIIMKEVVVKKGKRKEAVEGIFQDIGVRVNIGETRRRKFRERDRNNTDKIT